MGPQGPPGPASGGSGLTLRTIVDARGVEVGVIDLASNTVTRRLGDVVITLAAVPQGFVRNDVVFLHTSGDCSGPRYLPNNAGGFTHAGYLVGNAVFFTSLADPTNPLHSSELNSFEVVRADADPAAPGACTAYAMGFQSVGPAESFVDSSINALTAPFYLQ